MKMTCFVQSIWININMCLCFVSNRKPGKRCIFCITTADEFKISARHFHWKPNEKKKNLKCFLLFFIFKNSEAYEESPYLAFKDAHHWVNKEWRRRVVGMKCCIFTISIFCKPASWNDGNKPKYIIIIYEKSERKLYICSQLQQHITQSCHSRTAFSVFVFCYARERKKKKQFYLKICCRL